MVRTSKIYSLSNFQVYNTVLSLLSLFSCSVLSDSFSTSWTVALQAPLSMGILQARILEWVAISFSRGSSQPRDRTSISCISRWVLSHWATREAHNTVLWTPITTLDLQNLLLDVCTLWPIFPHYPCTFSQPLATTILTAFDKFCIFGFHTTISDFLHLALMYSRSIHTDSRTSFSGWIIFHCLCLPHLLQALICRWTLKFHILPLMWPSYLFYLRLSCVSQLTCIGYTHITALHGNSPWMSTELITTFPSSLKSPQSISTSLYAFISHYSFLHSQCFSQAGIKYVIIKGPTCFYFLNGFLLIWGRSGFQAPDIPAG